MGNRALRPHLHRTHEIPVQGYIVHMLHRALLRGYIADATPAVGTEATLIHRHHRVELPESIAHRRGVLVRITQRNRVGAVKGRHRCLNAAEIGLAHRHQIGRCRLRYAPHRTLATLVVRVAALTNAAALRRPVRLALQAQRIGGLVGEIVAAREHRTPVHMRIPAESHAEVVAHSVVEMEAAPAASLHMARTVVPHCHLEHLAHSHARHGQRLQIRLLHRASGHRHRIGRANKVKAYRRTGTQQLHRQPCHTVERRPLAQVERQIVIQHIHRIGRLCHRRHKHARRQHP